MEQINHDDQSQGENKETGEIFTVFKLSIYTYAT